MRETVLKIARKLEDEGLRAVAAEIIKVAEHGDMSEVHVLYHYLRF